MLSQLPAKTAMPLQIADRHGTWQEGPDPTSGVFSRTEQFWQVPIQTQQAISAQFDRYDIDESGWIDTEAEISLLGEPRSCVTSGLTSTAPSCH